MTEVGLFLGCFARWITHGVFFVAAGGACAPSGAPRATPPLIAPVPTPSATVAMPSAANEAPESSDERDHECEATIDAPIDRVRALVTDYDHYASIMPKFGRSRVTKRGSDEAEVYLQVPVLHGAAQMWAMVRFAGPVPFGNGERIEGTYLHEGNVSAFHCVWTYSRIDDAHTLLHLGLLLLPKIPLPHSIIDKELNDACRDAIQGVKVHAEGAVHGSASSP